MVILAAPSPNSPLLDMQQPLASAIRPRTIRGRTFRVYIPHPSHSLKVIDDPNWTGRALDGNRSDWNWIAREQGERLRSVGVYILTGQLAEGADLRPALYVGEAEDLLDRISTHVADRGGLKLDFDWTRFIAFTTSNGSLTKAHALHIEDQLISIAKSVRKDKVLNGKQTKPRLGEQEIDFVESFLDSMLSVYSLLGVRSFDLTDDAVAAEEGEPIFYWRKKAARGVRIPKGFRVFSGAKFRKNMAPKLIEGARLFRQRLIGDPGLVVERKDYFEMIQDHDFDSPSQAAVFLAGASVSGPATWKLEDGRTLKAYTAETADRLRVDGSV